MQRLVVFQNQSIDGYFADRRGELGWAMGDEAPDEEFKAFIAENVQGNGLILLGRLTYELMAASWTTPQARESFPLVAERMNSARKFVFSRTLEQASWQNTTLVHSDPLEEIRRLKAEPGEGMAILGSGSLVAQLAVADVIDEYQIVVSPVILGAGRTMFDGIYRGLPLKLIRSRAFTNGKVLLCYEPREPRQ